MASLKWDQVGSRTYETGVHECALFVWDGTQTPNPWYGTGVAWQGITSVSENPSGAESTGLYADNIKYLNLLSAEDFGATIEAYTYPDDFMQCDGSAPLSSTIPGVYVGQQGRKTFGLVYKTLLGTDTDGTNSYKLHIIYGCTASPSEKAYTTVNDSPEAITFSWEVNTTAIDTGISGLKPTSNIVIDASKFTSDAQKAALTALNQYIYGTDTSGSVEGTDPQLPTPAKIIELLTVG